MTQLSLTERLKKIRATKAFFNIDQQKIADCCEPKRTRVTVARVLSGSDDRYFTEGNIAAIEKGIEKILDEYRRELNK